MFEFECGYQYPWLIVLACLAIGFYLSVSQSSPRAVREMLLRFSRQAGGVPMTEVQLQEALDKQRPMTRREIFLSFVCLGAAALLGFVLPC
jgi:hypothetical protein